MQTLDVTIDGKTYQLAVVWPSDVPLSLTVDGHVVELQMSRTDHIAANTSGNVLTGIAPNRKTVPAEWHASLYAE